MPYSKEQSFCPKYVFTPAKDPNNIPKSRRCGRGHLNVWPDPKMLFQYVPLQHSQTNWSKQTTGEKKKIVFFNYSIQANDRQKNYQEIISDTRVTEDFWALSAFRPKTKKTLNLKDLLVRAHLKPPGWQPPLLPVQRVTEGKATKMAHYHATLSQTKCVFLIPCRKCGIQYVGETNNSLGTCLIH